MMITSTPVRSQSLSRLSPVNPPAGQAVSGDEFVPASTTHAGAPPQKAPQTFEKPGSEEFGPKGWKKAALVSCLALSAFTGLAPSAHAAMVSMQQVDHSLTNGMKVVVLPSGTPRLDIFKSTKRGIDREVDPRDHSQVGVSLGHGLFHDVEGNLSVVPFLSYDWGLEAKDFERVDLGNKGQSVQRFGHTVQYSESSTKRNIYSETASSITLTGPHGRTVFQRQEDGSLEVQGPRGKYTVKEDGMMIKIQAEGEPEISILRAGNEIRVLEGQRAFAGSSLNEGTINMKGPNGEAIVTRSETGVVTEIDGKRGLRDARIVRDGDNYLGLRDNDRMNINNRAILDEAKARYDEVIAQLEQVEPGFEAKHPLISEVLKYAASNPRLLTGANESGFLQAGTLLSTAGGAAETMSALGAQATALNLANSARALGAAALSAQAAAQAQAAAGNLAQAASLANGARNFAARAHEAKDAAMRTGGEAMKSATVARALIGVGGALQIVDGVLGYKGGKSDRALVEGARAVTESTMQHLVDQMTTPEDRMAVQDDFDKVMRVMDELDKQADKKVLVGKLKIGLGGLMVVSALLGPGAPPLLGAIGLAGTAGTAVYEHWGPIKSFLTGDSNKVPTFLDILPQSDEVIIRLDGKPIKK